VGLSLSLLAVWIVATFRDAEAVKCYQCNTNVASASDLQAACNDPFNSGGSGVTQCYGATCVKVSATSFTSGQSAAVRYCDNGTYINSCGISFQGSGAGIGCACQTDLCNMGDKLHSTSIAAAITIAIAFIASASRIFY